MVSVMYLTLKVSQQKNKEQYKKTKFVPFWLSVNVCRCLWLVCLNVELTNLEYL